MILEKKDSLNLDIMEVPAPLKPFASEAQQFIRLRNLYHSAIREVSTKLEILDDEFHVRNNYSPIHHMESRVKSVSSIMEKLERKGLAITNESVRQLTDIAGIRVICNYIDDVYNVADMLLSQADIELVRKRDYIANPKESGYRSLHVIVTVPVFLTESIEITPVEVQFRTIAMDTWASLEHELKYKSKGELSREAREDLIRCAADLADIDERMQRIHRSADDAAAEGRRK
ncbi:MAG: GTP pyrophosphokinase family protein [Eubacteriales bacterium]|nr:GTP pyrophosphokinase family protein [Eubacteriales bacterium]